MKFNPSKECGHVCECCGEPVGPHEAIDNRSECCGSEVMLKEKRMAVYSLFTDPQVIGGMLCQ